MIKILKDLGNNKYEVEIKDDPPIKGLRQYGFGIAHDYVHFEDFHYIRNENGSVSNIRTWVSVHIPIRTFINVCLPKLISHEYCQKEHLADRTHTEDDKYWDTVYNKGKYKGPRYKKGDKYPAYSYSNVAIYFWENGQRMVAFIQNGESNHSIMTAKTFDLIKDKIDFLSLE